MDSVYASDSVCVQLEGPGERNQNGGSRVGSVQILFEGMREGDQDASSKFWTRFFPCVTRRAERLLAKARLRIVDADDVASSVMRRIMTKGAQGDYPQIGGSSSLRKLLWTMTRQKVIDRIRWEQCPKRFAFGESAVCSPYGEGSQQITLDHVAGSDARPELLAAESEVVTAFLESLTPRERRVVELKLERCSNAEIAADIQRQTRTVERLLNTARAKWDAFCAE